MCFHSARSRRVFPVRAAKLSFRRKSSEEYQRGVAVKRIHPCSTPPASIRMQSVSVEQARYANCLAFTRRQRSVEGERIDHVLVSAPTVLLLRMIVSREVEATGSAVIHYGPRKRTKKRDSRHGDHQVEVRPNRTASYYSRPQQRARCWPAILFLFLPRCWGRHRSRRRSKVRGVLTSNVSDRRPNRHRRASRRWRDRAFFVGDYLPLPSPRVLLCFATRMIAIHLEWQVLVAKSLNPPCG